MTRETVEPVVCLARAEDVSAIRAMVKAAYSKYIDRMGMLPAPMTADYEELLKLKTLYILRDRDSGTVMGSVVLTRAEDALQIGSVVVDPTMQGRGYGRILISYAEDLARSVDLRAVTLYTNEMMHENLQLYPKLGYEEVDRRVDRGYKRVFFRKNLE